MIDSHCHLDYYPETYKDIILRAKDSGVKGMLTVSTKLEGVPFLQEIAESYKNIWCSVGVHPHEAQKTDLDYLLSLLNHKKVVAIGETGLDYFYKNSEPKNQIESFEVHLEACRQSHLPVIVHTREADQDTLASLDRYPDVKGVFHCFTGSYEFAKQGLDRGFMISFSGIITFKNTVDLCETVSKIPLESILIETDSPYLTPVPYRGQKNEPAFVSFVSQKIADIKKCSVEEVIEITTDNFFKTFKKASFES